MNRDQESIFAQAAEWHAVAADDAMDWTGFTAWLEQDPRHRTAYDEVALTDTLLDEHRETLRVASQVEPAEETEPVVLRPAVRGWTRWAGMAIAASLVALVALPQFIVPAPVAYRTGATARTIALQDGSSVTLAPHSRLTISGSDQDQMALTGGGWFAIRHDPSRALSITAGDVEIRDIGTSFDVQANNGLVRIEVGEGVVTVASQALAEPIRLPHGQGLLFNRKAGTAQIAPLSPDNIGEWRSGRLSFDSAPLALVAEDLGRYAGVRVTMPDTLRDRQFSGTLVIGDGKAALRDLSQLMGLELGSSAGAYRLGEPR